MGWIERAEEVDSTSEVLKRRVEAGLAGEAALLAVRQTAGRGRLGRPWRSVDGNLHLSVLLRPATLAYPGHWSLLAAVALMETLQQHLVNADLRLKWPNDVLLGGAKLAGILLEAGFDGGPWLVIGFGVNLVGAPADVGQRTACVADWMQPPGPPEFAARLVAALQRWRGVYAAAGFVPVKAAWLAAGPELGSGVTVRIGERLTQGTFRGIEADGSLLIEGDGGIEAVAAGVVV